MLKKFALWFICFGLSFLVEGIGWAEQGKAFLFIHLGQTGILFAILILTSLFIGNGLKERIGIPMIAAFIYGGIVAIILFATWVATKLFYVNFYVAYQIMTFGQCLFFSNKEDN